VPDQDAGRSERGEVPGCCLLGHLGAFHVAAAPYPVTEDRVEHRVQRAFGQAMFLGKRRNGWSISRFRCAMAEDDTRTPAEIKQAKVALPA
jgi:hypothetical protein